MDICSGEVHSILSVRMASMVNSPLFCQKKKQWLLWLANAGTVTA